MYEPQDMVNQLTSLLASIEEQEDCMIQFALEELRISPYEMRNPDGSWAMAGLLQAKAQTLSSLILIGEI